MFYVALADDVRRQCLLRTHFAVFEQFGIISLNILAKELVVLGVMTRNVVIYNEFEFLELEQVLHRELERGGSVAASGVVWHRTDSRFQRLHRLDNGVYHQLRTWKIAAKDVEASQRGSCHRKDVVFLGEVVDFLDGSRRMMVNFQSTPLVFGVIEVQEAHRLTERRASETVNVYYLVHLVNPV